MLLASCSPASKESKRTALRAEAEATLNTSAVYVVDTTTGLCYMFYGIVSNAVAATRGMTNVPCDEVFKLNKADAGISCHEKCYNVCRELTNEK